MGGRDALAGPGKGTRPPGGNVKRIAFPSPLRDGAL